MENNENFVANVTENVEQTTEEVAGQPKMFTQDELNQAVSKGKARERAKLQKQYEKKYGDLENVLKAGTGKESVEEMTDTFTKFYESKGITISKKPEYSQEDVEILAKADADSIIRMGYEDVVEEVDRLTDLGFDNMTAREKAYFKVLAEHRMDTERHNELAKIGVTDDVYNSKEFKDFAGKFNSTIPIAEIYGYYAKQQPKKEIKQMGSMKNTASADTGVKEFYTYEEAKQFKKEDFDKNPALYEAVKKSMTQW